MLARVERDGSDAWRVISNGSVISAGLSNAQAWRLADRINSECVSRSEDVAEWVAKRMASGE